MSSQKNEISLQSLNEMSEQSITQGSKSFALASFLFNQKTKRASHYLYSWCRYCDDQIDETIDQQEALQKYQQLEKLTHLSLQEQKIPPIFQAFHHVREEYSIPRDYALDLLAGMKMDLEISRYQDFHQLKLYCYRVAGTVGLMMSYIMGVRNTKALDHAVNLGIAMQLTNIARDVFEDYAKGRIYLPQTLLNHFQVNQQNFTHASEKEKIFKCAQELLKVADAYYFSGRQGLKYLPLRSAFTILVASFIYQEIGQKILQKKTAAWNQRVFTSKREKIFLIITSVKHLLPLMVGRLKQKYHEQANRLADTSDHHLSTLNKEFIWKFPV